MASEIRVNRLSNRSGLSTITFANGGVQFSGITTFANGDFRVGTGATILNPSTNEMQFHTGGSNRFTINNSGANLGTGNITAVDATFSGNVSIGKTLTYEDVKNVDSVGVVTARTGVKVTGGDFTVGTAITASSVTGNVTQDVGITTFSGSATWFKGTTANKDMYWSKSSGSLVFKDNAAALFGSNSDLQIYHNGSHSYITEGSGSTPGDLHIQANNLKLRNWDGGQNYLTGTSSGSVELFHDGNKKFETVTHGVKTEANLFLNDSTSGNIGRMKLGDSADLQIFHTGGGAQINNSTGWLYIQSDNLLLRDKSNAHSYLQAVTNGSVDLYHNNSKKFETTNTGVKIDNSSTTDMLLLDVGGTNFAKIGHNSASGVAVLDVRSEGHTRFLTGGNNERLRIAATGAFGLSGATYGSSGQVLTSAGSGSAPTWTTISGGVSSDAQNNTVGGDAAGNALDGDTLGNTLFGENAGLAINSGDYNHFFGYEAGKSITSGNYNIAMGFEALKTSTTGGGNIAIGHKACNGGDITGANNIAIGYETMKSIVGNVNGSIAIGYRAAYSQTGDCYQTAVGYEACYTNTTVTGNTGIGHKALRAATGGQNTAVGWEAGNDLSTAHSAVLIGYNAGSKLTTGVDNTAVGRATLGAGASAPTTAAYCVAIGKNALNDLTSGNMNYAVGASAGRLITTGTDNVLMGYSAGGAITDGTTNTVVGCGALQNNNVTGNVAVGRFAGLNCDGDNNVYLGKQAGYGNASGSTGDNNIAVGYNALQDLTTGNNNVAIGFEAGKDLTTAGNNTVVGYKALPAVQTTGTDNVAVGYEALRYCTVGYKNVAVGGNAGEDITTGERNVCVGWRAGNYIRTGFDNVYIGYDCDASAEGDDGAVIVGKGLGGKGGHKAYIGGSSGAYNEQNYSTWSTTSDRRIKKNIVNNTTGLDKINQITVRNFEYKKFKKDDDGVYLKDSNGKFIPETADDEITWSEFDGGNTNSNSIIVKKTGIQVGAVAQELESVLPGLVETDPKHGLKSVNTDNLVWYLVNAVKELSTKNDALEARFAALEGS